MKLNFLHVQPSPTASKNWSRSLSSLPQVTEVYYQKNMVTVINQNVKRISIVLLVISLLLALIFIALINNTIRITVYSQRFIINTMQMVGATNSFIRKPFLWRSFWLGIYGSLSCRSNPVCGNLFIQKRITEELFQFMILKTWGLYFCWSSCLV